MRTVLHDSFGSRVAALLDERRCSLSELSARTGISVSYLSRITNGHVSNPTLDFAVRIAVGLGVGLNALVTLPESGPTADQGDEADERRQVDRLRDAVRRLERLADRSASVSGAQTIDDLINDARAQIQQGNFREAAASYDSAIAQAELGTNDSLLLGRLYVEAIAPHFVLCRYGLCFDLATKARRAIERRPAVDKELQVMLAMAYAWLGELSLVDGKKWLVPRFLEKALQYCDDREDVIIMVAGTKIGIGDYASAESMLTKLLREDKPSSGDDTALHVLNELTALYIRQYRLTLALTCCRESLEIRRNLPSNHSARGDRLSLAITNSYISEIAILRRRWTEAETNIINAVHLFSSIGDEDDVARQYYWLSLLFLQRDRNFSVARKYAQQYLDAFDKYTAVEWIRGKVMIVCIDIIEGRLAAVNDTLQTLVQEFDALDDQYHAAQSAASIGMAFGESGHRTGAIEWLRRAADHFRQLGLPERARYCDAALRRFSSGNGRGARPLRAREAAGHGNVRPHAHVSPVPD